MEGFRLSRFLRDNPMSPGSFTSAVGSLPTEMLDRHVLMNPTTEGIAQTALAGTFLAKISNY
jgi:hypothetical protein